MERPWRVGLAVLVAFVCASRVASGAESVAPPEGYRWEFSYSSSAPDDYWVLAGPAQSYGKYRVNDELKSALQAYFGRATAAAGAPTARVLVHLDSVTTDYQAIGSRSPSEGEGSIRLAMGGDDGGPHIPAKITKVVVFNLTLEVSVGGGEARAASFAATTVEEIGRERWTLWADSFYDLFRTAYRNAVKDTDRVLRREMAAGKST